MDIFGNREEAGKLLAVRLEKYRGTDAIILAVPRGGVPVAYEIAKELNLPLDVILTKKIGHPGNSEYAIGSVSMQSYVIDDHPEVPQTYYDKAIKGIREEIAGKYKLYEGERHRLNYKNKILIIVDDGIATGNTLLAGIKMLRQSAPAKIVVAAPVVPLSNIDRIKKAADEFIYLMAPEFFSGVGAFYEDFDQVKDEEVIRLLHDINSMHLTHQ